MSTTTMRKCPYTESIGTVMTNFDHSIEHALAERLKVEEVAAMYSAWEFCGDVWWDRELGSWCCVVNRYHTHVQTLVADSLEEIMRVASEEYGDA